MKLLIIPIMLIILASFVHATVCGTNYAIGEVDGNLNEKIKKYLELYEKSRQQPNLSGIVISSIIA